MENSNSSINQKIKDKFVSREVLTCFSSEMQEVLKHDIVSYEDIENCYEDVCPECGHDELYYDEEKQAYYCDACDETFEDPDQQPVEIYEWWIVTDYLCRKLSEKGQPVLEWGNNCYWGRCCTGQAILLDSVISEICSDMEILEGEKNEWKI